MSDLPTTVPLCKANKRGSGVASESGSNAKRRRCASRKRRSARATSSISCCLALSPRSSRRRCVRRASTPAGWAAAPGASALDLAGSGPTGLRASHRRFRLASGMPATRAARLQEATTSGTDRTSRRPVPTPRMLRPPRRRSAPRRSEWRRARRGDRADRADDPGRRSRTRLDRSSRARPR
jgi:hypothetical protein